MKHQWLTNNVCGVCQALQLTFNYGDECPGGQEPLQVLEQGSALLARVDALEKELRDIKVAVLDYQLSRHHDTMWPDERQKLFERILFLTGATTLNDVGLLAARAKLG